MKLIFLIFASIVGLNAYAFDCPDCINVAKNSSNQDFNRILNAQSRALEGLESIAHKIGIDLSQPDAKCAETSVTYVLCSRKEKQQYYFGTIYNSLKETQFKIIAPEKWKSSLNNLASNPNGKITNPCLSKTNLEKDEEIVTTTPYSVQKTIVVCPAALVYPHTDNLLFQDIAHESYHLYERELSPNKRYDQDQKLFAYSESSAVSLEFLIVQNTTASGCVYEIPSYMDRPDVKANFQTLPKTCGGDNDGYVYNSNVRSNSNK